MAALCRGESALYQRFFIRHQRRQVSKNLNHQSRIHPLLVLIYSPLFLQSFIIRIDLLVSHSSGIFPTMHLFLELKHPKICGMALFSPNVFRTKAVKPLWFTNILVNAYPNPILRAILCGIGPTLFKLAGTATRVDSMDHPVLSATTVYYGNASKLEAQLCKVKESRLPMLFVFGENDSLMDCDQLYEMAHILGVGPEMMDVFDENLRAISVRGNKLI